MTNENQARLLLETTLRLVKKFGVEVSFVPLGGKEAVKLPETLEQYVFKASKAEVDP
jgi:hypothetical protein